MLADAFDLSTRTFRTHADTLPDLRAACEAHPDLAQSHEIGTSEGGRPLCGVVLGRGPVTVSLIAGAHADEPVGPETLRLLVTEGLGTEALRDFFGRFRFVIVPHVNPDGEAANRRWIEEWPDVQAYLAHAHREPPGRDLEFGFPAMRRENHAVADFLAAHAPFALHMSLHGMGFAEGVLLLIERTWADRTLALQAAWRERVARLGLPLHDHDRGGEKGFAYLGPGFTTTPRGAAMRQYFRAMDDEATATLFHQSSMEYVQSLGGDPLCLVTEVPLFLLSADPPTSPGVPGKYLAWKEKLPDLKLRRGEDVAGEIAAFGLTPVPLAVAVRLQLDALELGLGMVY